MCKIKKEYEDVLREAKVLTKYVKNAKKAHGGIKGYRLMLSDVNDRPNFYRFMAASFIWAETPERHEFWSEIANWQYK